MIPSFKYLLACNSSDLTLLTECLTFQMQRSGIQPDVVSYALLIKAYGRARREEEALSVFEEMLDAGVRSVFWFPTTILLLLLLMRLQSRPLFRIYYLSSIVFRPTHKAYNILLDAFAISGMVEQAKTVFKSMRRDR